MIDYLGLVKRFMRERGYLPLCKDGVKPPPSLINFRVALMLEELTELVTALNRGDRIDIADALCDHLYTVFGTAAALGYTSKALGELFNEVHESNMTKRPVETSPGAVKYTNKGPAWRPPDLAPILRRHRLIS